MKKKYFVATAELCAELDDGFKKGDSGTGALVVILPIVLITDLLQWPFILYHNLKLKNE